MKEIDNEEIYRKIGALEKHIINLIIPIQEVTHLLRDSEKIQKLLNFLEKPLSIDDRFFRSLLQELTNNLREFKESSEKLDIVQTLSEIKYIGNRLNKIERDIEEIKKDGIKRKVNLEFTCGGYELVKKPASYEKEQPIVDPNMNLQKALDTLCERESKVLIHRFGLFGENKKTLSDIAKKFGLVSGESIRRIEAKALRKLRHPERKKYVDLITHVELKKAITGD